VTLKVLVDGVPMGDDDARAFWKRFSDHLEANRGDLLGFAKAEGLASVHPETRGGMPVLIASRSASQQPYTTARGGPPLRDDGGARASKPGGGSAPPRVGGEKAPSRGGSGGKRGGSRG
jgi:hypothetical protein